MQIKTINDYYEDVRKLWPRLPKKDIERILNYGFRSLYLHNSYGGDTFIKDKDFLCYIGYLRNNSIKHFEYYIKKLALKIRILYKRRKIQWDGYYYFTRNENQYKDYLSQSRRKYKIFKNVFLFKLLEEVKIRNSADPYIFRLKEEKTKWMKKFYPELKTDNAELITVRDALNMKDIMTSYNKFKYIQQ